MPTKSSHSGDLKQPAADVMSKLDYYLVAKAPYTIPDRSREWIVKYGPWIDVAILILLAPAILLTLGLATFFTPFAALGGVHALGGLIFAEVALMIQILLMLIALPGLFARKQSGWNFAFAGVVFNLAYNVLSFNVVGGAIAAVLGSYILFQIRNYYK